MQPTPFMLAAVAALVLPAAALADPAPAAPGKIGPCDGVFAQVAGMTDYRFDGFSESDRRPTWQATAYCYRDDGSFVGATFTGVDFLDSPRTHFEADWYVGRQFRVRGFTTTLDLFYASFPDKRAPGPSYNIIEPQAEVARSFRRLTLKGSAAWTPNDSGAGPAWHLKTSASYRLAPWLTLSAEAGRYLERGAGGYDHWDIGATATWRRLTLDARYGGTDRSLAQCYGVNWCQPGVYATVSYRLFP
jgi:uncharacterized protein (TIGR02001 family)